MMVAFLSLLRFFVSLQSLLLIYHRDDLTPGWGGRRFLLKEGEDWGGDFIKGNEGGREGEGEGA